MQQAVKHLKSSVFWDITLCSPLKINRNFEENMSPPSSGSKDKTNHKPARKQVTSRASVGFSIGLFFDTEDRGDMLL
jgi:hypothetical protein